MAGRGGGAARSRTPAATARGRRQTRASLPLDMLVDIAARTDPATLVRCAATCVDMRRRIKDYTRLGGRLHLRRGDRFVLPLLRGHLIHTYKYGRAQRQDHLSLLDTTAADATMLRRVTGVEGFPLSSSNGLVLTRVTRSLRVCDPDAGRRRILPSNKLTFPVDVVGTEQDDAMTSYALLVGDDDDDGATAVGRQFHVVMAYLELSKHCRNVHFQTFSSEHGAWGCCNKIRVPNLQGSKLQLPLGTALVVGDTAHWLCLTNTGDYVLKIHVRMEQVTVMKLPESFPRSWCYHQLLATSSAGGCPIVLTADDDKISAWAQSKQTGQWKRQPQVVIETETILQFLQEAGGSRPPPSRWPVKYELKLLCFAERSGTVLIKVLNNMSPLGYFWLNLQSMKIIRWFSDRGLEYATGNIPYEMNLAAWIPTFSSTL
ncbi:hypothetical protein D1007_55901 [Hordeum vulgare]|nr:hypothetical protein D1007_55901 [Hordeum vulgare]